MATSKKFRSMWTSKKFYSDWRKKAIEILMVWVLVFYILGVSIYASYACIDLLFTCFNIPGCI